MRVRHSGLGRSECLKAMWMDCQCGILEPHEQHVLGAPEEKRHAGGNAAAALGSRGGWCLLQPWEKPDMCPPPPQDPHRAVSTRQWCSVSEPLTQLSCIVQDEPQINTGP